MFALSEIWLLSTGFFVSLLGSVLIVLSKRWHGSLTFDTFTGPQKFHDKPTPRIGGLTLFVAFWMVVMATSQPTQSLLIVLGMSGSLAFLAGLMEDLTKRAPVVLRLLATIISGLLFCVMTGYSVTQTEVYLVDDLIERHFVSLVFTALAISGLTNAINVIDGFNGLAAGAVIIMASAFGVVAYMVDDYELVLLAAIIVAVLLGFLLVNFPWGYIFLGDGGAYFAGFLLASLAIMLPVRNSEISEWVSIMILAYPVLEFAHSIYQKKRSVKRHRPTRPDKVHLHMFGLPELCPQDCKIAEKRKARQCHHQRAALGRNNEQSGFRRIHSTHPGMGNAGIRVAVHSILHGIPTSGIAASPSYSANPQKTGEKIPGTSSLEKKGIIYLSAHMEKINDEKIRNKHIEPNQNYDKNIPLAKFVLQIEWLREEMKTKFYQWDAFLEGLLSL